jgi:hypothetical protein
MDDPFCALYVDTPLDHRALLRAISGLTAGTEEMRTVSSADLEITVLEGDYPRSQLAEAPDDFVRFPYVLEVNPGPALADDHDAYVTRLGALLLAMSALGLRVVAACDFEERLPGHGKLLAPPSQP